MEQEGTSDRREDESVIPELLEALAGLDAEARQAITQAIALHREFPAWAVWLPAQGRPWIAVRPASARVPSPGLPLIWSQAVTASDLSAKMRGADAQLAGPNW